MMARLFRSIDGFSGRALAAGLVVATSVAAHAQNEAADEADVAIEAQAAKDERNVDELVRSLDDPSWEDRELATAALAINDGISLDALVRRLGREDLSPEQRRRLERAAEARFMRMPAAGLGVQFRGGAQISLARVLPNFPAAETLRAGDRIIGLHGEPLESTNAMRAAILGHLPGETLPMRVVRRTPQGEAETLDVEVTLGAYSDLGNQGDPPAPLRRAGFAWRIDRQARPPQPETLGDGVGVRDWLEAEGLWPPPGPDTPIGETGLQVGQREGPGRYLKIAGQGDGMLPGDVLGRGGRLVRNRRMARGIGVGAGSTALEEVVAGYRLTLLRIATIDRQLLEGAKGEGRAAGARAANLRQERADMFESLQQFVRFIEQADTQGNPAEQRAE